MGVMIGNCGGVPSAKNWRRARTSEGKTGAIELSKMALGLRYSNPQASIHERTAGGRIGTHQFIRTFLRDSLTGRVPHRCTALLPHLVGCAVHPVNNTLDGADEKITLGRSGHFLVVTEHAVGRRDGELTSVLQVADYRQNPPPCRSSHVREASHEHHGITYVGHHLVRERRAER